MGVNLADFWHLTPHDLYLIAEGYKISFNRQIERDNVIAHIQGAYMVEALLATVGNMFSSKGHKKHEYPDKPYDLKLDDEREKRKTEQENNNQIQLFAAQLTTAMVNFKVSHSNDIETEISQGQG